MGKRSICLLATTLMLVGTLPGQGAFQVYVPDDLPGQGACSASPFGLATCTAEWVIPASSLGTQGGLIDEIAFAPCGSGSFTAPTLQVALGHLPFSYYGGTPSIQNGVVTGSAGFSQLVVPHDSALDGAFSFTLTQDQWSPLGFANRPHGTGFVWDGVRDVGLFMTWSGATGGASLHTAFGSTLLGYSTGYQAPLGTTFYAGGRMRLTLRPLVTPPGVQSIGNPCQYVGLPALVSTNLPFLGSPRVGLGLPNPIGAGLPPYLLYFALGTVPGYALAPPFQCPAYLENASAVAFIAQGFGPFPGTSTSTLAQTWVFSVPDNPALAGATVAVQAVHPFYLATTNALEFVLN